MGCRSWSPASLVPQPPRRRSPVGGRDRCLVVVGNAADLGVILRTARAGVCPLRTGGNNVGLALGLAVALRGLRGLGLLGLLGLRLAPVAVGRRLRLRLGLGRG